MIRVHACFDVLERGFDFDGAPLRFLPAHSRMHNLFLRDLPVVISDAVVSSFLSEYGEVLSVEYGYYTVFPSLQNRNRVVKILLSKDIPGFVQIDGFDCRVW